MSLFRISVFALLLASSSFAQDFTTLAQNALELQQSGHYAEAADVYRRLLKMDPSQVPTHVNLAIVLVNLGDFDQAIAEYQAADKLLPGDPRIALNLALAYQKSGQIEEARRRFEALHEAYPSEAQPTLLLADCSLQLGDNTQVIELLKPIAEQNSDDLAVAYMLGMALLREHDTDQAQIYLDRILKHGDTAQARFLLGTRMFESGDYPAAVKELADAIALNSKLPGLQSAYGEALLFTGDPDGAAAAFHAQLELDPTDFNSNLGLAQVLIAREDGRSALPYARAAQSRRPHDPRANLALAQSLTASHEFQQARPYAETAAATKPDDPELQHTLADVYTALHESTLAAEAVQRAHTLDLAAQAAAPGPKVNEFAPDFVLPRSTGSGTTALHDYRGKSPIVLLFGSYTCPNFRSSADALRALGQRYGAHIPFLLVYIREAHAAGDWQSTRNRSADALLAPAATMDEKRDYAATCSRKLHLDFPAVVDGLDNAVESAYSAWPSRAFIVGADGRILYSTHLTELDFHPGDMEAVLQQLTKGGAKP